MTQYTYMSAIIFLRVKKKKKTILVDFVKKLHMSYFRIIRKYNKSKYK